jgi:hypothetical protein
MSLLFCVANPTLTTSRFDMVPAANLGNFVGKVVKKCSGGGRKVDAIAESA